MAWKRSSIIEMSIRLWFSASRTLFINLKIGSAIQANALLFLSIPYVLLLLFAELFKSKSKFFASLYKILYSAKAIWTVILIVVFWWIARNL